MDKNSISEDFIKFMTNLSSGNFGEIDKLSNEEKIEYLNLFIELLASHQSVHIREVNDDSDKECTPMCLEEIKNKPYEGIKKIFIEFGAIRDGVHVYHTNLKPIHFGFYEYGDGGSEACIFAGDLSYEELINLYEFYMNPNDEKLEDDQTEIITSFEYNGWNFDREDLIFELNEAEDYIKNYAENGVLPYKRLRKDIYTKSNCEDSAFIEKNKDRR